MKNINGLIVFVSVLLAVSCSHKKTPAHPMLTIDKRMIDSIRQHSDSTYEKPYKRTDWVTAEYFISKKDSAVTQLMKDSGGLVRQIIVERAHRRIYFAQFYPNGQQQFKTKMDAFGQPDGYSEEYYLNGNLKRTGTYKGGLHVGQWKNYDEDGGYTFTQEYNNDGQEVDKYKE